MARNSSWPDHFDHTPAGKFSGLYHFIDAKDKPPTSCNVNFNRDCKIQGCVISAIANFTERVRDTKLDSEQIREALLYLIHFFGDVTQPLHNEDIKRGGNDIHVVFNRKQTNLHSVWDSSVPEMMIGGYHLLDAQRWAQLLISEINSGSFRSHAASWIAGDNVSNAKGSAMRWSRESNAFVCSVVMPHGYEVLQGVDLYPAYYNSTISTVNLQIARGGYRLANWLNMLAAKSENVEDSIDAKTLFTQKPLSFEA